MTVGSGTKLGPFEVLRELGRGGMGVVYLATDTQVEKSFQQRSDSLPQVKWQFGFEALRSNSRCANPVRRLGLEP
ncbi:MAG TPA: hypothetical protein VKM94_11045 [Blastocatellia bacterium]|nr:hypothetical protein [Blastocatellia bacterium]